MNRLRLAIVLCIAASSSITCFASTESERPAGSAAVSYSSSAALPEAPEPNTGAYLMQAIPAGAGYHAFSALAVAVKVGAQGVGFDVATPLTRKLNLRAGASFLSYTHQLTEDGININPDLEFRNAGASLDFYPFGGGFRLSPGVVFYNDNHANAAALVPGGQSFTLNDESYTSSPTDPVHGTAAIDFNKYKVAPSFTVGWGNMIPRSGRHWSVPFEVGFEYVGQPTFVYTLAGTACNQYGCMNVATSPEVQSNIQAEQTTLNNDISPLRFFPILSIGLGYRF